MWGDTETVCQSQSISLEIRLFSTWFKQNSTTVSFLAEWAFVFVNILFSILIIASKADKLIYLPNLNYLACWTKSLIISGKIFIANFIW